MVINMTIKEMRYRTGLTQKEFATRFDIPIGTLRRWEYGESTPAPYVVKLIARELFIDKEFLTKISDGTGNTFFYDSNAGYIMDSKGVKIYIQKDLSGVKEKNLIIYVKELFTSYYDIVEKFNEDCRLDMTEDIIWR